MHTSHSMCHNPYGRRLKITSLLVSSIFFTACGGGNGGGSGGDSSSPVVNPPPPVNVVPSANAGVDSSVNEQTLVSLTGSGSDSDGSIASYQWQQTAGTAVILSNASTAAAQFTAPDINADETLTFELTVTDDDGATATDTTDITLLRVNQPPVAQAGETQTADEMTNVTLQGSGSDSDGSIVSYQWQQTAGTAVTLSNVSGAATQFTAPDINLDETLTFALTVTDDEGATATDTTDITLLKVNQAPVAQAGEAQTVDELTSVTLQGSGSDVDGIVTTYSWRQLAGPIAVLKDADSAIATFIAPDVTGREKLLFQLTVTDNDGATHADSVEVIVQLAVTSELIDKLVFVDGDVAQCVQRTAAANGWTVIAQMTSLECFANIGSLGGISQLTALTQLRLRCQDGSRSCQLNHEFGDLLPLSGLASLAELYFSSDSVSNLVPLAGMTSLRQLEIISDSVADLNPLKGLSGLEQLYISSNKVRDLSPLGELKQVAKLYLQDAQMEDFAPLALMTSLADLEINTGTTDITITLPQLPALNRLKVRSAHFSGLAHVTSLKQLELQTSSEVSLNGIEQLTGLTHLISINNGLTTMEPFINLVSLQYLRVSGSELTSVSPLGTMPELTRVRLSFNQKLTDISGLSNLTAVTHLELNDNQITDISALSNLTSLTDIELLDNQIEVIAPLGRLKSLERLIMTNNKLTDVSGLAGLSALTHLNLMSNQLSSVDTLPLLESLQQLLLNINLLTDVDSFAAYPLLTSLNLQDNEIVGLSGLVGLPAITDLRLRGNNISDFSPLTQLSTLQSLVLDENSITTLSPMATANLPALTALSVSFGVLNDLTGLEQLSGLKEVKLHWNQIADISALFHLINATEISLNGNDNLTCADLDALKQALSSTEITGPFRCQ